MNEPEIAFADLEDNMALAERMIKYVIREVLEKCPDDMAFFNEFFDKGLLDRLNALVEAEFAHVTYTEAVEKLLDAANITCNKNTIPNDPKSPFVTSGIRLGTPAVTSRGMNTQDMDRIAEAIAMVIMGGEEKVADARAIVKELTDKYPLEAL